MNQKPEIIQKNSEEKKSSSNELWLAGSLVYFFIFIMTFIGSGIITAIFFLVWGFGMMFTIMIGIKILIRLELKDTPRKIEDK